MGELTQAQKAAAFDTLVHWLKETQKEMDRKADLSTQSLKIEIFRAKADVLETAAAMAVEIASQIATTEQALNMPPSGLDLSKHVGQTAVLHDGTQFPIELRHGRLSEYYIDDCPYDVEGFVLPKDKDHSCNIKTILPC